MRRLVILVLLSVATVASADPAPPQADEVTSYRAYTLATDAASAGLIVGGFVTEGPGGMDTTTSTRLLGAGMAAGFFATPIVHLLRGHVERAGASLALRGSFAMIGMLVGVVVAKQSCAPHEILCGADGLGPGVLGGLVVASVVDATFLTDERKPASTWAPQLSASRGAVSVAVAARF